MGNDLVTLREYSSQISKDIIFRLNYERAKEGEGEKVRGRMSQVTQKEGSLRLERVCHTQVRQRRLLLPLNRTQKSNAILQVGYIIRGSLPGI